MTEERVQVIAGEVVVYEDARGGPRVEVVIGKDTVWLSLNQIAEVFQRDKSVISRHLKSIFDRGELERAAVVAENATTATDGKTYAVAYYNLDAILSVGYRVNSARGTQFRRWANNVLRDHLLRGYTLNEKRLLARGVEFDQAVALPTATLRKNETLTPEGQAILDGSRARNRPFARSSGPLAVDRWPRPVASRFRP